MGADGHAPMKKSRVSHGRYFGTSSRALRVIVLLCEHDNGVATAALSVLRVLQRDYCTARPAVVYVLAVDLYTSMCDELHPPPFQDKLSTLQIVE